MRLTKNDDVIQALAADRPDQPFGKAVLPRRGWCGRASTSKSMPMPGVPQKNPADAGAFEFEFGRNQYLATTGPPKR
jgi:hypothetical protein